MDRNALKRDLTHQFEQSLDKAMDAVEQAPDGRWVAGSEWEIREIFQKLMAQSFERILQARLDAADQAAFSPCGPAVAEPGKTGRGSFVRRR